VSHMNDLAIDEANAARSRRGKNSRARGNAFERTIAAKINGTRVGHFGGKADVQHPLYVIQTKKLKAFPERIWGWLKDLNPKADQIPLVIIGDAPGPGGRTRIMVCMDFDDFVESYGKPEAEE